MQASVVCLAPDGAFGVPVISGRSYSLQVIDPRKRGEESLWHDVQAGSRDLTLLLGEGNRSIEVLATDQAGRTVTSCFVTLRGRDKRHLRCRQRRQQDGVVVVQMPSVPFELGASARGHRLKWVGAFDPDTTPARITVELEPAASITGRVLADGKGLAGATVHAHIMPSTKVVRYYQVDLYSRLSAPARGIAATKTDREGRYRLFVTGPAIYVVHAEAPGFARAESNLVKLAADESSAGIDLSMQAGGAIAGRLLVAPSVGVEGSVVAATRGDGHLRIQVVGVDGRFRFAQLAPGGWQIVRCESEDLRFLNDGRTWPCHELAELPVHVFVQAGRTTSHDLDPVETRFRSPS